MVIQVEELTVGYMGEGSGSLGESGKFGLSGLIEVGIAVTVVASDRAGETDREAFRSGK